MGFISFIGHISAAQTEITKTAIQPVLPPQFMVSWKADSYAPSWYQGKILPSKGSRVNVGFELIQNGKIVDLSKNRVRWYINDKLAKNETSGLGIKDFSFVVSDYGGEETEVKIAVLPCESRCEGYKGGGILYKTTTIPVSNLEAVIDAPYKNRAVAYGKNSFFAHLFFFNIGDLSKLSFEWLVNEEKANVGERRDILDLNIGQSAIPGTDIGLRLVIKNPAEELEFAGANIKLTVK